MQQGHSKLLALQKAGMTNEELINFLVKEAKDENLAANIKEAFKTASLGKMSKEEAYRHVGQILERGLSSVFFY